METEQDKALTALARRAAQWLIEHDRKQAELEALWDKFWAHLQAKGAIG